MNKVVVFSIIGLLIAGCSKSEHKMLSVSVTGSGPVKDITFEGTFTYTRDDERITEKISGDGNITRGVKGDEITSVNVRKTSGEGAIMLMVGVDGQFIYTSPRSEDVIDWKLEE